MICICGHAKGSHTGARLLTCSQCSTCCGFIAKSTTYAELRTIGEAKKELRIKDRTKMQTRFPWG